MFGLPLLFPFFKFPLPLNALVESENVGQDTAGDGFNLVLGNIGIVDESLVSLCNSDISHIIQYFTPVLKTDANVVEFGLLQQTGHALKPYLIDFVDDNSPTMVSRYIWFDRR